MPTSAAARFDWPVRRRLAPRSAAFMVKPLRLGRRSAGEPVRNGHKLLSACANAQPSGSSLRRERKWTLVFPLTHRVAKSPKSMDFDRPKSRVWSDSTRRCPNLTRRCPNLTNGIGTWSDLTRRRALFSTCEDGPCAIPARRASRCRSRGARASVILPLRSRPMRDSGNDSLWRFGAA